MIPGGASPRSLGEIMSSAIKSTELASGQAQPAPGRNWAAHLDTLRTPELRSALEELHARLEPYFKDAVQA
jgi:hypothetical protein